MKTATFTEFRNNASNYFDEVEKGEKIVIIRHGKPVAEIIPIQAQTDQPSWKQPGLRLQKKGLSLSQAIIKDRRKNK